MKKTLVVTVYFNQEKFLDYQFKCVTKYLKEEFHFCFFDNSPNGMDSSLGKNYEGFEYFRVPQDIFTGGGASTRAGQSLDYAVKQSLLKYSEVENVIILDSDMFPVRNFTFESLTQGNDFAGIIQQRGHVFYYNNQLVFFKRKEIKKWDNFSFDAVMVEGEATDCGGNLFFFFRDDNSHLKRKNIRGVHSNQLTSENISESKEIKEIDGDSDLLYSFFKSDISLNGGSSFSEIYGSTFLHFRAGSNWINFSESAKVERERNLFDYLNKITL
jgi:hypothetical protein